MMFWILFILACAAQIAFFISYFVLMKIKQKGNLASYSSH